MKRQKIFFGYSVAVSGNTVVVGAYGDDTYGLLNTGSSYIYKVESSKSAMTDPALMLYLLN